MLTRADRVRRSTPAGVLWSSEGPYMYVHTVQSERGFACMHSFLPSELSFQWSMKRSIQATLTGEAFKAKPVYGESSVGSRNQTLYCEFVDAFCRVSPRARAVAISEAQDEWRKVHSNPADLRRRIDELNAMVQKAKCASGWKVREHLISSQFFSKRNAFRNGGRGAALVSDGKSQIAHFPQKRKIDFEETFEVRIERKCPALSLLKPR